MRLLNFNRHLVPFNQKAKDFVSFDLKGPAIMVGTNQRPSMHVLKIGLNRLSRGGRFIQIRKCSIQ